MNSETTEDLNIFEIKTEDLNIGDIYFDKMKNKNIGKLRNKIILGYDNSAEKKPYYKLIFEKEYTTLILIRDYNYTFFKEI